MFGLAIFVPGIAAGLVSGAPQLGAGAAVATTAALVGTAVAGGMLTAGGAAPGGPRVRRRASAAASLTGTVGAAYEAGGTRRGAHHRDRAGLALDRSGTAPVRDAYRQGAAHGYRDARPPPSRATGRGADALATGAAQPDAPAWAQSLARRQRLTHAGLVAAQALREGDRPDQRRPGSQGQELTEGHSDAFKRSALRYGETPEPVTPYQKAAQVWDERIGSPARQAHNWRLLALGCLALSLILAAPALARPHRHRRRRTWSRSIRTAARARSGPRPKPTGRPTRRSPSTWRASSRTCARCRSIRWSCARTGSGPTTSSPTGRR